MIYLHFITTVHTILHITNFFLERFTRLDHANSYLFQSFIWFGDVESWKQMRFEDDEEVEVLISEDLSQDQFTSQNVYLRTEKIRFFCISIVQMIFTDPPWPYTMILLVLIPLLSETTAVRVDSPGEEGGPHPSSQYPG